MFHGIPTYVALLELWGTLILICCIFMLHELCMRLKMKRSGEAVAMLVFACSPLIIWITKSSLTEIGMTLDWLVFLYLIFGDDRREQMLSAFCIWVYAFYHVSVYVFMPFYVLLYLALYLYTKDRVNIKAMILAVAGYLTGYWMSLMIAARYLDKNYVWIYHAGINGQSGILVPLLVYGSVLFATGKWLEDWKRAVMLGCFFY